MKCRPEQFSAFFYFCGALSKGNTSETFFRGQRAFHEIHDKNDMDDAARKDMSDAVGLAIQFMKSPSAKSIFLRQVETFNTDAESKIVYKTFKKIMEGFEDTPVSERLGLGYLLEPNGVLNIHFRPEGRGPVEV